MVSFGSPPPGHKHFTCDRLGATYDACTSSAPTSPSRSVWYTAEEKNADIFKVYNDCCMTSRDMKQLPAYAGCTCSITRVRTLYHSSAIMKTIRSVQPVTENYRPYGSSLLDPSRTILEKWLWTVNRQGYLLTQSLRISPRYPNTNLKTDEIYKKKKKT